LKSGEYYKYSTQKSYLLKAITSWLRDAYLNKSWSWAGASILHVFL